MGASTSVPARVGKLSGLRVLVAEDVWVDADLLCVILMEEGATVLGPFNTAAKAIEVVRNEEVDLALVDMELADAFADDLAAEINAHSVPYAIITGFRALPSNADADAIGVLRKPYTSKALIDLLTRDRGRDPP